MGRKWGQHFLRCQRTIDKIIASAQLTAQEVVLEIGPGEGVLTTALCDKAARVHAFEIDPALAKGLSRFNLDTLHVHQGDFLTMDLPQVLGEDFGRPCVVVANLPYYITAPIVERLVWQQSLPLDRLVLMMQEEVAQRICHPGTRTAGALSYIAGAFFEPEYLFQVPPGSFSPPPKVYSVVISLTKRPCEVPPLPELCRMYEVLVATSFRTRRKQLGKSLKGLRPDAADLLSAAGIDSKRRPETLLVSEFWDLAKIWISSGTD